MDTTTGYRRNLDVEGKACLLMQLDRLRQEAEKTLAAIQSAIKAPGKAMCQVSVSSNSGGRHAEARGRTVQNALLNATRRYRAIYQVQVHSKDKITAWAKFPGGIEFKLPRRLGRSYSDRAIRQQPR